MNYTKNLAHMVSHQTVDVGLLLGQRRMRLSNGKPASC